MRIGELAKNAHVGVETVRFYEQKGLVARPRRPAGGGYRDYPADTVRRVRFIRSAQHLGFSLNEVAELLDLEAGDGARCVDVRERAEMKRAEVEEKLEDLQRIKQALDALIEACPDEGPAQTCSILEAINRGELYLSAKTKRETNGGHNRSD